MLSVYIKWDFKKRRQLPNSNEKLCSIYYCLSNPYLTQWICGQVCHSQHFACQCKTNILNYLEHWYMKDQSMENIVGCTVYFRFEDKEPFPYIRYSYDRQNARRADNRVQSWCQVVSYCFVALFIQARQFNDVPAF